ncbi:chorismate mutase [Oscillatoria sp. CS-180]|uniref:chorismate mutase n=1 Tax=Oscillatoria sp. CS-180 TaxID=3021720 RepID=UPI00232DC7AF|nr:chorismate mutase [Oscillatoria sp. CS-180]MDB9529897.1 chorismate mutase [Oscillatoria sp. CS-180]
MEWRMQAIRGATTVSKNVADQIAAATHELLDAIESENRLSPEHIISVTFSVTKDLDALFPAAAARQRPGWDAVSLLDVQHMHVTGSLPRCIRVLIHAQIPVLHEEVCHIYLRDAQQLRPDLSDRAVSVSSNRE